MFNKMIILYYVYGLLCFVFMPVWLNAGNIVYNPGFECISSGVEDVSVPEGWVVSPSNVSRHVGHHMRKWRVAVRSHRSERWTMEQGAPWWPGTVHPPER